MPNEEQIEHWDGAGGEHWAAYAERYDAVLAPYADVVVERLAPQVGERVLDVGCGNGALALAVAPRVGEVVGLDISGPMLDCARRRAVDAGLANVTFEKGDAQVHPLPEGGFDAAMSRFGVMFFEDPAAAFANIGQGLRPGGRMVFAVWQRLFDNEWITAPMGAALAHVPMPELPSDPFAPGPFSLAEPDRVRSVFTEAGLADVDVTAADMQACYGATVEDAVTFFQGTDMARTLMKEADEATVARAWEAVAEALQPYASDEGVLLWGRAWLLSATKPEIS